MNEVKDKWPRRMVVYKETEKSYGITHYECANKDCDCDVNELQKFFDSHQDAEIAGWRKVVSVDGSAMWYCPSCEDGPQIDMEEWKNGRT